MAYTYLSRLLVVLCHVYRVDQLLQESFNFGVEMDEECLQKFAFHGAVFEMMRMAGADELWSEGHLQPGAGTHHYCPQRSHRPAQAQVSELVPRPPSSCSLICPSTFAFVSPPRTALLSSLGSRWLLLIQASITASPFSPSLHLVPCLCSAISRTQHEGTYLKEANARINPIFRAAQRAAPGE